MLAMAASDLLIVIVAYLGASDAYDNYRFQCRRFITHVCHSCDAI